MRLGTASFSTRPPSVLKASEIYWNLFIFALVLLIRILIVVSTVGVRISLCFVWNVKFCFYFNLNLCHSILSWLLKLDDFQVIWSHFVISLHGVFSYCSCFFCWFGNVGRVVGRLYFSSQSSHKLYSHSHHAWICILCYELIQNPKNKKVQKHHNKTEISRSILCLIFWVIYDNMFLQKNISSQNY